MASEATAQAVGSDVRTDVAAGEQPAVLLVSFQALVAERERDRARGSGSEISPRARRNVVRPSAVTLMALVGNAAICVNGRPQSRGTLPAKRSRRSTTSTIPGSTPEAARAILDHNAPTVLGLSPAKPAAIAHEPANPAAHNNAVISST